MTKTPVVATVLTVALTLLSYRADAFPGLPPPPPGGGLPPLHAGPGLPRGPVGPGLRGVHPGAFRGAPLGRAVGAPPRGLNGHALGVRGGAGRIGGYSGRSTTAAAAGVYRGGSYGNAGWRGRYGSRYSRHAWRWAATAASVAAASGYDYAERGNSGCVLERRTIRRNGWYRYVWVRVCDED